MPQSTSKTQRAPLRISERGLVSSKDAAEYLSISETRFFQLIAEKDSMIKPRRLGVNVRYLVSELDNYIDSLPIGAGSYRGDTR